MKYLRNKKYICKLVTAFLVLTFLRIAIPAMPYDWNLLLNFRAILSLLSQSLFHSAWLLWDLILLACGIGWVFLSSWPEDHGKWERVALPIIALVTAFVLTAPLVVHTINAAVTGYDDYQDALLQDQLEKNYQQLQAFLEDTDVGYAYNTSTQRHDPEFLERFPELASTHPYTDGQGGHFIGHHATDVVLLDLDNHRVGIIYFRYGTLEFNLYELQPVDQIPHQFQQQITQLPSPAKTFVSYSYSYELPQYTDALVLTMEDGSLYAVTDLCQENSMLFLGLNSQLELLDYWSDIYD